MKKVFFWLFYLVFLIFFDIVLVIIRFNNSIYDFLTSLNIKNEWILERLFSLEEIIFIIISLIFAYLISKIKVGKKKFVNSSISYSNNKSSDTFFCIKIHNVPWWYGRKYIFCIFHGSRLWSLYGNDKFILLFGIIVQFI